MISMEHCVLLSIVLITIQGTSSTRDNKTGTCKAPILKNGRHVPNKLLFEVGEWLQYHCDEGYTTAQRNIMDNVQCLSSGWSKVPQCSAITCSLPPVTGLDKLHLVTTNGKVSTFSCNDGFTLKGSDISQCYYYGWDPPLPVCQASDDRIRCPPPPQPFFIRENKLKSEYFSGDKEIITCRPGFQLHGAQSVVCKNGQWTSPPQCIRSHACNDPPSILFGTLDSASVKPKYQSGSVVTYKCNNGFEVSGLPEIVCIDGNWSSPPTCISNSDSCRLSADKITSNNLVLPKSASMGKAYSDGDSIPTRCKTGYYRVSSTSAVECVNGKMIYPKCTQEKPCRISQEKMDENFLELPDSDNKVYFENGEVINFRCKAGYTTTADKTGLCIKEDILYPFCHEI